MPRAKKKEQPAQLDIEHAIAATKAATLEALAKLMPEAMIKEFLELKTHSETQTKAFSEYLRPTVERMALLKAALHARALASKVNGFPTDEGTAYLSEITSHTFDPESKYIGVDNRVSTGRDATLDWLLDNWDEYGSEGMQLNVSKAIVEKWMENTQTEEHKDGLPPPGLKIEKFKQLNIRRS